IATLAVAVLLVTLVAATLQFAARSQVLIGKTVDETVQLEFTIEADSDHAYKITPGIKQFLEDHISFYTEGPARVVSAKVEITPKKVPRSETHRTITFTGAAMAAQLRWNTAADSASGAHGYIYLNFPEVPELKGKAPRFHSAEYQKDDKGRLVI